MTDLAPFRQAYGRVAELVASEDNARPLSDAAIQGALRREGIDVAFEARDSGRNDAVVKIDTRGNITPIAFSGQAAPGAPELVTGVVETFTLFSDVTFNDNGQVAFVATT